MMDNQSVEISVIIPAYNAEQTISRAIHSVLTQNIEKTEIIVVNDGSSDATKTIANDFARRDSRVRVVNQQNCGLGATRNIGIGLARGKVIALLDSDDEFVPGSFVRVLDAFSRADADLVASDLVVIDENGVSKPSSVLSLKRFPEESVIVGSETKSMFCNRVLSSFCPTYFYKKDFITKNEIRFPEPGRFLEDIVFMSEIFSKNPTVACLAGGPTYRYYMRSDSLAHSRDVSKARQAINSILLTENNLKGIPEKNKFIIEQLLFAYYLASNDESLDGGLVRKQIVDEIKNKQLSSILSLQLKDIIKTILILLNARTILRMMYKR